jgi:hypothetical protein
VAKRLVVHLLPEAEFQNVIEEIKDSLGFLGGYWGVSVEADNTLEVITCK